jgi:hypothetical protein
MRSPFPGMNPYLEHPALWSSFHFRLISTILSSLDSALPPQYYTEIKTHTYQVLEGSEEDEEGQWVRNRSTGFSADSSRSQDEQSNITAVTPPLKCPQSVILPMRVTLKERYLEVRELSSEAIITIVKVLTPRNKRRGRGRTVYERKRSRILGSMSHLIEIDLLRGYAPMTMSGVVQPTDYRIMVSRAVQRPKADVYGFNLSKSIPSFPLPLKPGDVELIVDLQTIVMGVYERAGYGDRIDYRQSVPAPALSPAQQQWVDSLLESIRGDHGTSRQ